MTESAPPPRVVYLVGAGASHACIEAVGSPRGILMKHLNRPLSDRIHDLVTKKKRKYRSLARLVNELVDENADFEHLITFLDDSPSLVHKQLANDLRTTFEGVLRQELGDVRRELGDDRYRLYSALLDMYRVKHCPERLQAILTTNYDDYIERATQHVYGAPPDLGIRLRGSPPTFAPVTLLKLHGSFQWRDRWPIEHNPRNAGRPLWIPPGIQKRKDHYPFNVLWGTARQTLDCDVLRIVGCRLSPSDWDLVSLLFGTRHAATGAPYIVEVIDSPEHARSLRQAYPYLDVRSILEIDTMDVGKQLVGEYSGGPPRPFRSLSDDEQGVVLATAGVHRNWFRIWLEQMAEAFARSPAISGLRTDTGEFEKLLEGT